MQSKISIQKPCHENWQNMSTTEQGRFCAQCNKVVTDFTAMSNEEILSYLQKQKGEVCGRVKKEQLHIKPHISDKLKQFLYAFCLVFLPYLGFGQSSTLNSDSLTTTIDNTIKIKTELQNR